MFPNGSEPFFDQCDLDHEVNETIREAGTIDHRPKDDHPENECQAEDGPHQGRDLERRPGVDLANYSSDSAYGCHWDPVFVVRSLRTKAGKPVVPSFS